VSESHDITDQPRAAPPSREPAAPPAPATIKVWLYVLGWGLGTLLLCGLAIAAVARTREAAARAQSKNNLMAMGVAVSNLASNCPGQAYIPPASGAYPSGSPNRSFFAHLQPYIESPDKGSHDIPVRTYIAPADPRNPGTDATISYASNATLLGVTPPTPPRVPQAFNGRTSSLIVVMERSGLDGAHKWNNLDSNWLGERNSPPPPPQFGAAPFAYLDGSPQAFTSAGCMVLLGDGTARPVGSKIAPAVWNSLCDPSASAPPDW
jgi:hypothetical protein